MLITSLTQIKRQHARNLAEKIRLEAMLAADCRRLIKHVAKDFEAHYVARGRNAIDFNEYQDEFNGILKTHYRVVAGAFKRNIRESAKAVSYKPEEAAKVIDSKLVEYIQTRAKKQTGYILSTLKQSVSEDIHRVTIEAAAQGVSLKPAEIGKKVSRRISDRAAGEANTMALTETQDIAEEAKLTEASVLSEVGEVKVDKLWSATLDEVTRMAHIFADGQVAGLNEPFIVGAQQLMRPGDTSMGADLWNIINCRCNTMYLDEAAGKAARIIYEHKFLKAA